MAKGKPSPGTPKDKRLKANKPKSTKKKGKKGLPPGFKPFTKKGK